MKLEQRSLCCCAPSHGALAEASEEDQGTSPPQTQVPTRPCPTSQHAWLPKPPAQAHPSTWCVLAHANMGILLWVCYSQEDKTAALGGHSRGDPTGITGPALQLAASGVPFLSAPCSVLQRAAARCSRCPFQGHHSAWHCQGDSPSPNTSWHQGLGQKGGRTTLRMPLVLPTRVGFVSNRIPIPCQVDATWLQNPPPSTDHPQAPSKPSLELSQAQQAQLFAGLAETSPCPVP